MPKKTYESALFERMKELTRTPEQNAARTCELAESVRDLPLDRWPAEWTVDTLLAVAFTAKTPAGDLLRFLRAKFPASF